MKKNFILLLTSLLCLAAFATSVSTIPAFPESSLPSGSVISIITSTLPTTTTAASTTLPSEVTAPVVTIVRESNPSTTVPLESTLESGPSTTVPLESTLVSKPPPTIPLGYTPLEIYTPTTTLVCGNDENVCYVEFDITGDNKLECCNEGNNPVCAMCFLPCGGICHERGEGIKFCFGTNISFTCECTRGTMPTCYSTTTTTSTVVSTTYAGIVDATKSNRPLFYFIFLVLLFIVLAALIYYVRNI